MQVQLMAVIENVMPKFITIEEVDGFLFHSVDLDRKAADDKKERVRKSPLLHDAVCLLMVKFWGMQGSALGCTCTI